MGEVVTCLTCSNNRVHTQVHACIGLFKWSCTCCLNVEELLRSAVAFCPGFSVCADYKLPQSWLRELQMTVRTTNVDVLESS